MTVASRVFVGAGSNIDPRANLEAACAALRERYGKLTLSPVYESPAEGFEGPPFLNLVASFATEQPPGEILRVLAALEARAGRDRSAGKFSSRSIDLDLLLHGDIVDAALKLPHPDIDRYPFVARPLADLAPDLRHPVTGAALGVLHEQMPKARPLTPVSPLRLPCPAEASL